MPASNDARKPLLIALETSGNCCSVALVSPGHLLAEYSLNISGTHSRRLLAGVDWIMQECQTSWQQISAIAVSLGPGSFTGLRIGLSTAKGLAMACNKKIIGVPTLDSLAWQLPFASLPVCPIIDARKKEIYTAFYMADNQTGMPQQCSDYRAVRPDKLVEEIKQPTLFIGDGVGVYGDYFKKNLGKLYCEAPQELLFSKASAIGTLALAMWERGEVIEPATVTPIYVRKSDAELNFGMAKSR